MDRYHVFTRASSPPSDFRDTRAFGFACRTLLTIARQVFLPCSVNSFQTDACFFATIPSWPRINSVRLAHAVNKSLGRHVKYVPKTVTAPTVPRHRHYPLSAVTMAFRCVPYTRRRCSLSRAPASRNRAHRRRSFWTADGWAILLRPNALHAPRRSGMTSPSRCFVSRKSAHHCIIFARSARYSAR